MEEKKTLKSFITKETTISAVIGLLVGIGITCLVIFLFGYFAKFAGVAKLKFGKETIATVNGKPITAEKLYNNAKISNGLTLMLNEVDKAIFEDKYELTDKKMQEIRDEANEYIEYYDSLGELNHFLAYYGCANKEDLINYLILNEKTNQYLYDYLEAKLDTGAVQKYYDENKDSIETYDSEHILVKITDEVTDEQALALANEIIVKLNEGKTFDDIIEEYGDKIVHENLGYQGKTSSLQQSYIDELVALEDGKYSQTPVKTTYGYHIVHKIATSTVEDLRGTIIEKLSEDLVEADENLYYKAFVELREKENLSIFDEQLKAEYEESKNEMYK